MLKHRTSILPCFTKISEQAAATTLTLQASKDRNSGELLAALLPEQGSFPISLPMCRKILLPRACGVDVTYNRRTSIRKEEH
jgi:hypothetical protein